MRLNRGVAIFGVHLSRSANSKHNFRMNAIIQLQTPRVALVDALRQERAAALTQVLGIVGFALLTMLGAQIRLYLWEVPFTLQTFAIYGSGLYLGWRGGVLSQLLYLAIGLFLPVYAADGMGLAYYYTVPSAGYLLAAPAVAGLVGLLSRRWNSLSGSMLSMLFGAAVVFVCGVTWLHFAADHATWIESLDKGFLRFIPIDLMKIAAVGLLYAGSRRF